MSPDIQNEMIDIIAKAIVFKIVGEINESGVYSVMLDETMDVSKVEEVSFCVRYVDQMGVVQECRLGFTQQKQQHCLIEL
jgi:hypothetical protein